MVFRQEFHVPSPNTTWDPGFRDSDEGQGRLSAPSCVWLGVIACSPLLATL